MCDDDCIILNEMRRLFSKVKTCMNCLTRELWASESTFSFGFMNSLKSAKSDLVDICWFTWLSLDFPKRVRLRARIIQLAHKWTKATTTAMANLICIGELVNGQVRE